MIYAKLIIVPIFLVFANLVGQSNLVNAGDVRLFNHTGVEISIGDVDSGTTTAGELKRLVASKANVDSNTFGLVKIINNTLLEDEKLLSDYMSVHEGQLFVIVCQDLTDKGLVFVYLGNQRFGLQVKKETTLAWLKNQSLGNRDQNDFRVFFQGKELTDDSRTLGELKFFEGAIVMMYKNDDQFKLTVVPSIGQEQEFRVTSNTNVDDLRLMLKDAGFEIDKQLLLHEGKVLESGTNLFSHYVPTIYDDYVIHLVDRLASAGDKLTLFRRKPEGIEHFKVYVKQSTTLGELKKFAFKADTSIPIEEMEVKFNNLLLKGDSRTLNEFNLYRGAWLQVTSQRK